MDRHYGNIIPATREYALVKDVYPGLNSDITQIENLVEMDNKVYFTATADVNSGVHDVYMTDGTEAGTILLFQSTGTEKCNAPYLAKAGSHVFFTTTIDGQGTYLYSINGSTVTQLKQIWAEGLVISTVYLDQYSSASYGGYLFFLGYDAAHGTELWRSDGTSAGTGLYADLSYNPPGGNVFFSTFYDFVEVNNQLFFGGVYKTFVSTENTTGIPGSGYEVTHSGLFKLTSPSSAPNMFYDYGQNDEINGSHISETFFSFTQQNGPAVLNGVLYFRGLREAGNTSISTGLARTDGTAAGTYFVQEFTDNSTDVIPQMSKFNDKIIFEKVEASDRSLWLTDGTENGTYKIGDKFVNSGNVGRFYIRGNRMYASGLLRWNCTCSQLGCMVNRWH